MNSNTEIQLQTLKRFKQYFSLSQLESLRISVLVDRKNHTQIISDDYPAAIHISPICDKYNDNDLKENIMEKYPWNKICFDNLNTEFYDISLHYKNECVWFILIKSEMIVFLNP